MRKFSYLFLIILLLFACKNKNHSGENNPEENENKIEQINNNNDKTEEDFLTIKGNQIWVRSEPTTGEVVLKLDDGTKCKLIEKGEEETIKGVTDFWYKIEFEGKQGWVFGSQTNLSKNEVVEYTVEEEIELFITDFINAVNSNTGLSKYFVNDSVFKIYNPGAFPYVTTQHYSEIIDYFKGYKKGKIIFTDNLPVFDMNLYQYKEKGIYISTKNIDEELKSVWELQSEIYIEKPKNLTDYSEIKTNISYVVLITDINEGVHFYIGKNSGNWKIYVIDVCTHDA